MCGRSRCSLAPERVEQVAGVPRERWVDADRYHPSYNVLPGRWTPIVRLDELQVPMLQTMKWGLVPSFTKPGETPDHFKMFNARSETVTEKSIFSRLLPQQRCVVLLDGFYEWKADAGGKKQPYYVSFGEGQVMRMAGLFDVWKGGPEGAMATYTILTADASPKLTWLHNRMPVLLPDDDAVTAWLSGRSSSGGGGSNHKQQQQGCNELGLENKGSAEQADVKASAFTLVNQLCMPCNSDMLQWHPVTPAMSKPSYDGPDCCKDVRTKKGSISSFFKPRTTAGSSKETTVPAAAAATAGKALNEQQHLSMSSAAAAAAEAAVAAAITKHSEKELKPTHQQQHAASPASTKKGSISSFFKPVAVQDSKGPPQQQQHDHHQEVLIGKQEAQDEASALRNPDQQAGPSAADNAAAAAAGCGSTKRAAAEQQSGVSGRKKARAEA